MELVWEPLATHLRDRRVATTFVFAKLSGRYRWLEMYPEKEGEEYMLAYLFTERVLCVCAYSVSRYEPGSLTTLLLSACSPNEANPEAS